MRFFYDFFSSLFLLLTCFFFNTVDTKKLTGIWILPGLLVYYYLYTLPGGQNKVTGDLIFFFRNAMIAMNNLLCQ